MDRRRLIKRAITITDRPIVVKAGYKSDTTTWKAIVDVQQFAD
jgi:hypothetical protein